MNVADFTYLLQHPQKVVQPIQTKQLEEVLSEYPYFQAARALHLKGLKNLNSFKYNNALKVTAAYTTDRDILFDFITSEEFLQNTIADTILGKIKPIEEQEIESEEVVPNPEIDTTLISDSQDEPLPRTAKDAEDILDPSLFHSKDPEIDKEIAESKKRAKEALDLGQPLPFTKSEKHSFAEWLQLTSVTKVKQPKETAKEVPDEASSIDLSAEVASEKKKKFDLIDRFIEDNPKIIPQDYEPSKAAIKTTGKIDQDELMTETLAKVYLEQKKYKKAIQAYTILSLKYPEKSSFFATRIKAIKELQKENS
ncbi:MAG: hypothetical protein KJO51_08705 [Gramella sp.]|nr:hypothetical protein [Christiangramia sp.]